MTTLPIAHPCITGGKHPEFETAHKTLRAGLGASGLTIGAEVLPIAEGRGQFGTPELVADSGMKFSVMIGRKLERRPDLDPPTAVMPDYEPKRFGDDDEDDPKLLAEFLTLAKRVDDDTVKYMANISGATGHILGGAKRGFYGLPRLHGTRGYEQHQLDELKRIVEITQVSLVIPSMKIRRSVGEGITFDAQRRRVAIACEQLLDLFDGTGVEVWPETGPIMFGSGRVEFASDEDGRAQMEGFADAGITDIVLWLQGERNATAAIFFQAGLGFYAGMAKAAAPDPRPRTLVTADAEASS